MDIYKRFSLFGVNIYVTTFTMKRKSDARKAREKNIRKMKMMKHHLYRRHGGCCMVCGRREDLMDMELHHVVPVSEDPSMVARESNLMLVCHDCHKKIHRKKVSNNN